MDISRYPITRRIQELLDRIYRSQLVESSGDYLVRLVDSCRQELPTFPTPPASEDTGTEPLLLALLVVIRTANRKRRLGGESPEQLAVLARRERYRFELLYEAAKIREVSSKSLAWDVTQTAELLTAVFRFQRALLPRKLSSVLYGTIPGRERLAAFLGLADIPYDDLCRNALDVLTEAGLSEREARRLLDSLSPTWLCTYSDKHLRALAENFRLWDPLLRYITGDDMLCHDADIEKRVDELLREMTAYLRRKWRDPQFGCLIEDAAGAAIVAACDTMVQPGKGYCYEGSLPGWLYHTANTHVMAGLRDMPIDPGGVQSDPICILDPAADTSTAQRRATYDAWYPLIEDFFDEKRRAQVKVIWYRMLLTSDASDGSALETDEELADELSELPGGRLAPQTVATIRRRLRQRLASVCYVLEEEPVLDHDWAGDDSLLQYVRKKLGRKSGYSAKDVPTLRQIAAFARAMRGPLSIDLALLARRVIENVGLEYTDILPAVTADTGDRAAEDKRKWDRSVKWIANSHNRRLLRRLRGQAAREGIRFYLAPCWYMMVACGATKRAAIQTLNPGEETRPDSKRTEREALDLLISGLEGGSR